MHSPNRHRTPRWPLVGLVPMVGGSCAISQQQEQQLDVDYSTQIAQELPLLKDPEVVRSITTLGNSLASVTDTRGLTKDTPDFRTFRRRLLALPPSPEPKKP